MTENNQWSCLINKQGEVLEWENKAGVEYLTQLEQLCLYAQAFLYSDQTSLSFSIVCLINIGSRFC